MVTYLVKILPLTTWEAEHNATYLGALENKLRYCRGLQLEVKNRFGFRHTKN